MVIDQVTVINRYLYVIDNQQMCVNNCMGGALTTNSKVPGLIKGSANSVYEQWSQDNPNCAASYCEMR